MLGTVEDGNMTIISPNGSADYAFASFSGYVGFYGEIATRFGGTPGKAVGLVLNVSGGMVTGVFDSSMNPTKEYDNIIGTAIIGYGSGYYGGVLGGAITGALYGSEGGPYGAIVGAVIGAVLGGLYGDDIYNQLELLGNDFLDKLPGITDGINDALNTANQPLTPDIDGINDIIGDAAKDLGEILGDALKSIPDGEDIEDLLKDLGGILNDLLDKLPEDLVPDFLDGLLGGLDDIFPNGLLPYLLDLFPVELDPFVNVPWREALNWVAPRDPLVLDLDGDGIETIGISTTSHVMFDSDGDGVKTAIGWVKSDDGLLVLDRNGNGTIDNGSELFGDQTMVNGTKAKDGFSALSSEDTNKDGKFDANDTNFSNVKVWRDMDGDVLLLVA